MQRQSARVRSPVAPCSAELVSGSVSTLGDASDESDDMDDGSDDGPLTGSLLPAVTAGGGAGGGDRLIMGERTGGRPTLCSPGVVNAVKTHGTNCMTIMGLPHNYTQR